MGNTIEHDQKSPKNEEAFILGELRHYNNSQERYTFEQTFEE